jgi:hypothetical protein
MVNVDGFERYYTRKPYFPESAALGRGSKLKRGAFAPLFKKFPLSKQNIKA